MTKIITEVYTLPRSEAAPEDYTEIDFVCLRPDGAIETPSTVGLMCRTAAKKVPGLEGFHFHWLRHPNVKLATKHFLLIFKEILCIVLITVSP